MSSRDFKRKSRTTRRGGDPIDPVNPHRLAKRGSSFFAASGRRSSGGSSSSSRSRSRIRSSSSSSSSSGSGRSSITNYV